mmetsp:Transcript_10000/g.28439  ORF Transcript_10000/g.28439 Transcript_10000/m.28439 type:complete len:217 (+) Transcript_10000:1256-1906(+)
MHGSLAVGIRLVQWQAEVVQEANNLQVALVRSPVHGRVLVLVQDPRVRIHLHEKRHHVRLPVLGRNEQRSAPREVHTVDARPVVHQVPHRLQVSLGAGPVNGLHAHRVLGFLEERCAVVPQHLHGFQVSAFGRPVRQRVPSTVPLVEERFLVLGLLDQLHQLGREAVLHSEPRVHLGHHNLWAFPTRSGHLHRLHAHLPHHVVRQLHLLAICDELP